MIREALTAQNLAKLMPSEAAALFIARRSEGLTANERQLLEEWLARDGAHRRAFENAERAWSSFDDATGDEILAAMRAHALVSRRRTRPRWLPIAAAAALALVALSFVLSNRLDPDPGTGLQANTEYESVTGEVKELQLADGSRMILDADSVVQLAFTGDQRQLQLRKGRALFTVEPDVSRPFAVSAAGRSIVAVGTQFDVNIVADGLTVTLLVGRVDISSLDEGRSLVTLTPGQQYVERGGDAHIRTIGATIENVTAWQKGLINFDDQPLAEAAAIMNRYSSDQIVISAEAVAQIRLSGQFRAGESERFAATLAEMHGLRLVREGKRIELMREK